MPPMSKTEVLPVLEQLPLFRVLPAADQTALAELMFLRTYRKGMLIFLEGEPSEALHIVLTGLVRVFKTSLEGREQSIELLGPGEPFAVVGAIDEGPYPASAQAMTDAEVAVLPNRHFRAVLERSPPLMFHLLRVFCNRLRDAQNRVTEMALEDARHRLISTLVRLASQHGMPTADGWEVALTLSQQELATLAGTARETVARLWRELVEHGLVSNRAGGGFLLHAEKVQRWLP